MNQDDDLIIEADGSEEAGSEEELEAQESRVGAKADKLKRELEAVKKEKQEYLDGWQRAKADAINKQKEIEEKQKDFAIFANQKLLLEMIPVMDSFQMAMANKEAWNSVDANWRIGVEYIKNQLESVFSNHGLTVFGQVGEVANSDTYTSIETVATDNQALDSTVAEILQYGYKLKDRIIREAKCKTYIKN